MKSDNQYVSAKLGKQFLEEHLDELRNMIEIQHMPYWQIRDEIESKYNIKIADWVIGEVSRNHRFLNQNQSYSKKGDSNPAKNPEVKAKISNTVKKHWDEGNYDSRINGMTDKCFLLHPNYKLENHFREKYRYYHPDNRCFICGKDLSNEKWDVHHIDEDHNNILLTNLVGVCIPCHQLLHLNRYKLPYVTVDLTHELQYGHRLPDYEGKCYFPHGHRGVITIRVKRRIDRKTGFAIDFNILKNVVKEKVDSVLDHEWLNNYLENPTTEFSLLWLWEHLSLDLKGIQSITWSEGSKTSVTLTSEEMNKIAKLGQLECDWIPEEYQVQNQYELKFNKELLDYDSPYSLNASIDNECDFRWYYDMISKIHADIDEIFQRHSSSILDETVNSSCIVRD